jgi:dephospho-CoA kinase
VGVTGGIGAGKSTVCRVFEAHGGRVIDADAVGHAVLSDPNVAGMLAKAFGPDILDGEGTVIRRRLGERAFASEASREKLTGVVWPEIGRRIVSLVAEHEASDPNVTMVIDAPLLIEWDDPKAFCNVLVVVTAPEEARISRSMARLGLTREEVESRMAFQLPDEAKVRAADYVIENAGALCDVEGQADTVWRAIHRKN